MKMKILFIISFLLTLNFCKKSSSGSLSNLIKETLKQKPKDRKLFLTFSWNANEQRYVQRERMKEVMKNTLKNLMEKYQFDTHLDQWNHELLEDVHRQYYKAKSNVQLAKHFLIEKMDNIYNNFVQPARWFY